MGKPQVVLIVAVGLILAACSGSDDGHADNTVTGVVTEVSGDLTSVDSFVVLDDVGDSHLFTPQSGLEFYGGPLTHLRDHVVTGQRVTVTFEESTTGGMTATLVVHEEEDEPHQHG